jgi:uncharacterized protein (DUF3084 family)
MERMRELVQQTTSSSTQLAASAEQMSKMSRNLLDSMGRFELEENEPEIKRQEITSRPKGTARSRPATRQAAAGGRDV